MTVAALSLFCRVFRVPRRGHTEDECEDAAAIHVPAARFAVADGASESAHSGLWARLLVEAFARGEHEPPWPGWLAPLQHRWADSVRLPETETLPWFLEGRYREGAFATFLGLSLDGPRWTALAVGDSCVFQIRDNQLLLAFPLTHSSQFDNTPWLIGSRASTEEIPLRHALHLSGEWRPGDRLLLMTDALARWFLTSSEAGAQPWLAIEPLLHESEPAFAEWIARLRTERSLRNDDTTLVAVCV